jgi:hypothetical protein
LNCIYFRDNAERLSFEPFGNPLANCLKIFGNPIEAFYRFSEGTGNLCQHSCILATFANGTYLSRVASPYDHLPEDITGLWSSFQRVVPLIYK